MSDATGSGSSVGAVTEVLVDAERLAASGRALAAVDLLRDQARRAPSAAVEIKLAEVRHRAFRELPEAGFVDWPAPVDGVDRDGPASIPEVAPADLSADVVRRNILSHGSVLVPGLLADHVDQFVSGIDNALAVAPKPGALYPPADQSWHQPLRLPQDEIASLGRPWVYAAGGRLTADSPRLLHQLLEVFSALGLHEVVTGYLGERPVLSANKCTLRRVETTAGTDWHQDGAFLGPNIRALNIWIALTDCGTHAPGMDLLPRRFDHIVETGTGGAIFDWAVGPDTVTSLSTHHPVTRPQFQAGDALLFDDLYLHRTAIDPTMNQPRYAIESWFFAPTHYPHGQVPLVW